MRKRFLFRSCVALVFLAAAVVWLLSVLMPEKFKDVNLSWVIAVACGIIGLMFILRAVFSKTLVVAKRFYVLIGGLIIIAGVLALVGTFIAGKLVLPIIAVGLTAIALLSVLVVGGKKWDTADNEKPGYKNYYERKKEQEEQEKKEKK